MSPKVRKALLALHLLSSIGWVGGVLCYLALGATAPPSDDAATIRGAWIAMEVLGWWALVPQAVIALLTGILLCLLGRWGLIQHYWVVVALVLTTLCTVVLILHMPDVTATVDVARDADAVTLQTLGGDLAHPSIGLVLLLLVLVLNVYKPRGVTRRGWRVQQARRRSSATSEPA